MKILVTGYSGRFGPYMLRELIQAHHEPTLFGRKKPAGEISDRPWTAGDIMNFDDCRRAAGSARFDAVLHLAAQPWPTDHPRQQERREKAGLPVNHTVNVNVLSTYNLLHATMQAGIKLFVMTGSNCAIGHAMRVSGRDFPCRRLPVDEAQPSDAEDSYSFTKLVDEQLCAMYTRAYGVQTLLLRCAGLFDEATRKTIAEGNKPVAKWDWGMWAWVSREDAATAHRLLLENAGKLAPHDVFFCNADETFALEPSMELVNKFRPDLLPLVQEKLDGHASFFSNRKLREAAGWQPRIGWPR